MGGCFGEKQKNYSQITWKVKVARNCPIFSCYSL